MNENNYRLWILVRDENRRPHKIYVRKEKGHDWRIVWVDTGHWFAVNPKREKIRLTKSFRQLQKTLPLFASRVIRNFKES